MGNSGKWIVGIVAGFAGFAFLVMAFAFFLLATAVTTDSSASASEESYGGSGTERVAIVEIRDAIVDAEDVIRQLRKYRQRSSVKAIVLRLDSPGGAVVPSHEIHDEVRRTRRLGTPVVASMGSVAASGAYYIACAADRIVANPGSITGSIGVVSEFANFQPLLEKIGIENTTITSGEYKDTGNPTRRMRANEREYLQHTIDNIYEQFVDIVVRGRRMDADSVRALADGRIFTGQQAVANGLVDTLGTLSTAVRIAGNLGKIKGEPRVMREVEERTLLDMLVGTRTRQSIEEMGAQLRNASPLEYRMQY
ncbi:MAG: signal peptide peptidase SppA [Bacteroidota bacterium]|jgi:protease-4|nr:signal peptide peptidase SppA [Bacteroidota bacterium]